ncbi:MAG: hypothetical protein QMD77_01180 [Patescibacteria group bacterium]|nr:hypothetical protein [Patescibacteria group bacterium]
MFSKTTKIIILAMLIVVLALFAISSFRSSNRNIPVQENVVAPSFGIPSLPFSQSVKNINISDPKSEEDIKNAYYGFSQAESPKNGESNFLEMKLVSPSQENIPLNLFFKSLGAKIDPKIEKFVSQSDYSPFACSFGGGKKDYGLILNVGRFKSEDGVDYRTLPKQVDDGIVKWGGTILKDLQPILFPSVDFTEQQLVQKIDFKEGKYIYGEVVLPDGTKKSINYASIGDPIIITTSLECMDMAIEKIADETEQ